MGFIQAVFGTVKRIVEEGVRERAFRPVDPLLTHLTLIGSLVFFLATEEFRARALAAVQPPITPPTNPSSSAVTAAVAVLRAALAAAIGS